MPARFRFLFGRVYNPQVVYRFDDMSKIPFSEDPRPEFTYEIISETTIQKYFSNEHDILKSVKRSMDNGYVGAVAISGDSWASYIWLRLPGTHVPPGVPDKVAGDHYWMINGFTSKAFRRRGLFKLVVEFLLNHLFQNMLAGKSKPPVYAVPAAGNIGSRLSFVNMGFGEHGVLNAWYFWVPRLIRYPIWYRWSKDQPHPPLPPRPAAP